MLLRHSFQNQSNHIEKPRQNAGRIPHLKHLAVGILISQQLIHIHTCVRADMHNFKQQFRNCSADTGRIGLSRMYRRFRAHILHQLLRIFLQLLNLTLFKKLQNLPFLPVVLAGRNIPGSIYIVNIGNFPINRKVIQCFIGFHSGIAQFFKIGIYPTHAHLNLTGAMAGHLLIQFFQHIAFSYLCICNHNHIQIVANITAHSLFSSALTRIQQVLCHRSITQRRIIIGISESHTKRAFGIKINAQLLC